MERRHTRLSRHGGGGDLVQGMQAGNTHGRGERFRPKKTHENDALSTGDLQPPEKWRGYDDEDKIGGNVDASIGES